MIILGIDPGLNATGYGIIETGPERLRAVIAGDIRPPAKQPLTERLAVIHRELSALISRHRPAVAVLEKIFTHHSYVTTATLMGHARGVACLAAQEHGLLLAEYPPTQVKKSLTGSGAASKDQVSRMVGQWLASHDPSWSADATDALALAIVYAHTDARRQQLPAALLGRRR